MEGCSPIRIHFWVVISKLITLAALLKFPVTLSLFWKQWLSFQGISLAFYTTFLRGNDEKCSVYSPVWPTFYPDEPISYSGAKEKIGSFGFSSATWLDFMWGTTVMSFPEPIKVTRYLVPGGCVCPLVGSYLSSSWRMGSRLVFSMWSPGALSQPC